MKINYIILNDAWVSNYKRKPGGDYPNRAKVVTLMGTRVTIGRVYDGFWAVGNIIR